jgi:hypothetical protein
MTEVSGLDRRCGGQALEESAAPVAAGASEPSAPEPTGPEPRPPSGGLVASVHHDGGLRLVDPPWPRDICPGLLGRRGNVAAWPLLASPQAVSLLLNQVNDGLIAVVERMDRILLAPHGVPVLAAERDAQARICYYFLFTLKLC